jgi:hypothetical protein
MQEAAQASGQKISQIDEKFASMGIRRRAGSDKPWLPINVGNL